MFFDESTSNQIWPGFFDDPSDVRWWLWYRNLLSRGRILEFLSVFVVFGRFLWVSGLLSHPPGPILGFVFLQRCSVDRNLLVIG